MSPIEQAKAYYQSKGWSFEQDLGFYLCHGYVFSTPDRLLLAKPVRKEIGEADWHPSEPDCWYVHYAAGKGALQWFVGQAPFFLPYLGWTRNKGYNRIFRAYPTRLVCAKLASNDHGFRQDSHSPSRSSAHQHGGRIPQDGRDDGRPRASEADAGLGADAAS